MLTIGITTNIYRVVFLFVLMQSEIFALDKYRQIFIKVMVLSDIAMGLFYLWVIGWLWYNKMGTAIFSPLKFVGRMALTNYIMQSFIGLILFSSIGFSLYETLSPSETLLTAVVVFAFQVVWSKIWLNYFRYGPLEWIWRCLTYKAWLPIKY